MNETIQLAHPLPFSDRLILGIDAVLLAAFGVMLVVAPAALLSLIGVTLTVDGATLVKLLGGYMLGFGLLNWVARNSRSYRMTVGALVSNLLRTAVSSLVALEYTLHHNADSAALTVTALFILFTIAYGVLFVRRRRLIGHRSVGTLTSEEWF